MTADVSIHGRCDPRFRRVREAFASNFAERDEVGAAVCVWVEGRAVVDLWGGQADPTRDAPWREDTLVNAYSVGKGVLAALALALVERGKLALDAPVAKRWPGFEAEGKADVTLRMLLSHRAGLPSVRVRLPDEALFDWRVMCDALARQAPFWTPGSRHGYHVNTFGFLVGELVRRATGLRVGEALRCELAGPLGADFWWGVPRSELGRVARVCVADADARLTRPEQWATVFPASGDPERDLMVWHSYFNPSGLSGMGCVNSEAWRRAEIPSANGHATARGVAALYAALLAGRVAGAPFVGPALLAEARTPQADGDDAVLARSSRFGLGFQLPQPLRPLGIHPGAIGHYGRGGSLGFADAEAGVAFGYLTNRPGERWHTPRTQALVDALSACLGAS